MEFCALDVETANANSSSICQIGVSRFRSGEVVSELSSLINPEVHFDKANVSIHGITEEMVKDEPPFSEIWGKIQEFIHHDIIVSHTFFDKIALHKVCIEVGECLPENQWVDSSGVVRRVWEKYRNKGYGLANLAKDFGIETQHHNALSDARTCGIILVRAMIESGTSLNSWIPVRDSTNYFKPLPTSDGNFQGQRLVFTGGMLVPRREATKMAEDIGFCVVSGVSKNIKVLVVGDLSSIGLEGGGSSKYKKARELIAAGHRLSIVSESDFLHLVSEASVPAS
jgi:DNA polymerase III subunit epsilon